MTPTPPGWRDISTAPRDGTEVLAFARDPVLAGRKYYGVAQWSVESGDWFWPYAIRPTHWTELPPPPPEPTP